MENSYVYPLGVLSVVCIGLVLLDRRLASKKELGELRDTHLIPTHRANAFKLLMRKYLVVYALVMGESYIYLPSSVGLIAHQGADWLQGPYLYSLYREQYGFPEEVVAVLFLAGFLSAGLFAPLMGTWADQ